MRKGTARVLSYDTVCKTLRRCRTLSSTLDFQTLTFTFLVSVFNLQFSFIKSQMRESWLRKTSFSIIATQHYITCTHTVRAASYYIYNITATAWRLLWCFLYFDGCEAHTIMFFIFWLQQRKVWRCRKKNPKSTLQKEREKSIVRITPKRWH